MVDEIRSRTESVILRDSPQGRMAILSFPDYALAEQALGWASEKKMQVESFHRVVPRLEDVFLEVTKQAQSGKPESPLPVRSAENG